MKARIAVAVVVWAVAVVPPVVGAPCVGSAYPAAGFDTFPGVVTIAVDTDPGCGAPVSFSARGVTTIKRSDPYDPGDGRCTIDTEIVSLSMVGSDVSVQEAFGGSDPLDASDPPCTVGGAAADGGPGCSPGQVRAQTAGVDFPADSVFDVFLAFETIGSTVFNRDPIAVHSVIAALPPLGNVFSTTGACVPLYDVTDPFGSPVAYLASVSQQVGCGNGVVDPGEDCDGGPCCTADCTIAPSYVMCRGAANDCDAYETCDGVSTDCPADVRQPDGAPCSDGNQCTGPDSCQSGICTSGPTLGDGTPCEAGAECTGPDTCQAGTCVEGPPVTDGTSCNDHNQCTTLDTCTAGVCNGVRIPDCAPFSGDDTGFRPPDKMTAKCEDGVTKNVSTLVGNLVKCNVKDSDSALAGRPFDSQACQTKASGKWDTMVGKLVCPGCVNKPGIRDLTITLTNLNGQLVFCDTASGALLDPPGIGFVPANKVIAKCEDGAAKNVAKLTLGIGKCHIKAADSLLKNKSFDEEGCESAAMAKYDIAAGRLTGCPGCLDQGALRDLTETLLDSNNGMAYCASPSGAFIH